MRALAAAAIVLGMAGVAHGRDAGWFPLEVPGGEATLATLQVPPSRERAAVMIDLIRRLHFATASQEALTRALQTLKLTPPQGAPVIVPSPLPAAAWSAIVDRPVPAGRVFAEVLNDTNARLLFHGLAGMDEESRSWMAAQPSLLRRVYRHDAAVSAFALFAPAVVIREGRLLVPGGDGARQQWSNALGTSPDRPDRFVTRLFEDRDGRSAGLYFLIAYSPPDRQRFIANSAASFKELVQAFGNCYPSHANAFPFVLRSNDPALLLLDVPLDADGRLRGPRDRELWSAVLEQSVPALDAAAITEVLCRQESDDRRVVYETLLAAQRVFASYEPSTRDDAIAALRGRRSYPALFMAIEQADITRPDVYAAIMRHADRVAAVDDPSRAVTATRLFQGAVALTVHARRAGSLTIEQAQTLLLALARVPFENERYRGAIADWLESWLQTVRAGHAIPPTRTAEQVVAFALAGPATVAPPRVSWDGEDYLLDVRGAIEQRLTEVRQRQGGVSLDAVLEVNALGRPGSVANGALPDVTLTAADEYGDDALSRGELRDRRRFRDTVDYLLAHVLASWAYAPHVGDADGGAMVAGDGSLRHQLGVRLAGRARREQRWRVASAPSRGVVAGSLLALEAPLAGWSLRRLSAAAMPPRRQIGGNDLVSLMLTVALVDGRRLQPDQLTAIAAAVDRGTARINAARANAAALTQISGDVGMSPWRRAVLPWMLVHEPDRVVDQFSLTARARVGGLPETGFSAWGTANIVAGCLCVDFPPVKVPELTLGRAADGIVGAQSSDLMLRIATLLAELKLPAALAPSVLSYAMRDFLDHVQPQHPADFDAFERQARALTPRELEDYLSAIATVGPLRPAAPK